MIIEYAKDLSKVVMHLSPGHLVQAIQICGRLAFATSTQAEGQPVTKQLKEAIEMAEEFLENLPTRTEDQPVPANRAASLQKLSSHLLNMAGTPNLPISSVNKCLAARSEIKHSLLGFMYRLGVGILDDATMLRLQQKADAAIEEVQQFARRGKGGQS